MGTTETETPPREALELREATTAAGLNEDGSVLLHVIRPGVGRGRGRHLYEADMLRENAQKFTGWRMYVDHLSPEARKAAGGLPRSIRDLGGRIVESWWDENVPATDQYGQGAVVARAKPTPFVRELIENDPQIMEASISATATGVRPVQRDGKRVWMVEGIGDKGSVDWVTEAGAGGRVVSVMESVYDGPDAERQVLFESFTDEELLDALKAERPELFERVAAENPEEVEEQKKKTTTSEDEDEDEDEGGEEDDFEAEVQRLVKKGLPRNLAEKAARKKLASKTEEAAGDGDEEGDTEMGITPEQLQEAIQSSDALQEHIDALVEGRVRGLVEATLSDERDLIHEEAKANAGRQIELRDLRDQAHKQIEESRLPEAWKSEVKGQFDITDGRPTVALDVVDEIDDNGVVVKDAADILAEAVQAEVARQRTLLAAAQPTRVIGQGPSQSEDGEEKPQTLKGTLTGELLQESGFEDPDKVWAEA